MHRARLCSFEVKVKETDLRVSADRPLGFQTRESVLGYRGQIEAYIEKHPDFVTTLMPWLINEPAPAIVRAMIGAGRKAGVGPMAAVAGAIAERVARDLLVHSQEVIVENGGDIFLKLNDKFTAAIFAGPSCLSLQIGLEIDGGGRCWAVCTSSGTVGHSLSLGRADAVCVLSDDGALADAAATAIGNRIQSHRDISAAVDFGHSIAGVLGIVAICGEHIGAWGDLTIVPLGQKSVAF
jgi:hypothetical protein